MNRAISKWNKWYSIKFKPCWLLIRCQVIEFPWLLTLLHKQDCDDLISTFYIISTFDSAVVLSRAIFEHFLDVVYTLHGNTDSSGSWVHVHPCTPNALQYLQGRLYSMLWNPTDDKEVTGQGFICWRERLKGPRSPSCCSSACVCIIRCGTSGMNIAFLHDTAKKYGADSLEICRDEVENWWSSPFVASFKRHWDRDDWHQVKLQHWSTCFPKY